MKYLQQTQDEAFSRATINSEATFLSFRVLANTWWVQSRAYFIAESIQQNMATAPKVLSSNLSKDRANEKENSKSNNVNEDEK